MHKGFNREQNLLLQSVSFHKTTFDTWGQKEVLVKHGELVKLWKILVSSSAEYQTVGFVKLTWTEVIQLAASNVVISHKKFFLTLKNLIQKQNCGCVSSILEQWSLGTLFLN